MWYKTVRTTIATGALSVLAIGCGGGSSGSGSSSMTNTQVIGTNAQQFYRVVLLP